MARSIVLVLMAFGCTVAAELFDYSGKVTDLSGKPLAHALVTVPAAGTSVETDASGNYRLTGELAAVQRTLPLRSVSSVAVRNDGLYLTLGAPEMVMVRLFDLKGVVMQKNGPQRYPAGHTLLRIDRKSHASMSALAELTVGTSRTIFRMTDVGRAATVTATALTGTGGGASGGAAAVAPALIRASSAGHQSADTVPAGLSGTYNFTLETLSHDGLGTSGQEDGSADRLIYRGTEQYFWGDPGNGTEIPLVKVVTAVGEDAVDIALIFNPHFVDNTYGTTMIGWKKHILKDLLNSDHVALSVRNGDGEVVFEGKLDMITAAKGAPSGYATLGPFGGDGVITTGSAADVLSFGTSMDDNFNYYGYTLLENSPATDSVYSVNPEYPHWEYYAIYRISFDPAMFGASGYGEVQMTSVHASPAKTPISTITVTEKDPPTDVDDPFTFTHFNDPPTDRSDDPDQPPTDTTGDPDQPPTDTTGDPDQPPTDTTGDPDQPPTDTTGGNETPPTDSVGGSEVPPTDKIE